MATVDPQDRSWYHTIDLPDGTSTPGVFDHRVVATRVRWPDALAGGRCLDVGTCDGFWAFEMERRGAAEVVAVDIDDPTRLDGWSRLPAGDPDQAERRRALRGTNFEVARTITGSQVKRIDCSVYDLDPDVHGRFDVVFCGALLLHLRDPVGALERMGSVCSGELVLMECVDARLDLLAARIPCAWLAPVAGQWWRVNSAGLRQMLDLAGFDVVWTGRPLFTPFGGDNRRPPTPTGPRPASRSNVVRSVAAAVLRRRPDAPFVARAAGFALGANLLPVRARLRATAGGPDRAAGRAAAS